MASKKEEESTADAIAASQRLQSKLQKMIDEAEKEEDQDKELTDTQVALRLFGLTRAAPLQPAASPEYPFTKSLLPPAIGRCCGSQGPRS